MRKKEDYGNRVALSATYGQLMVSLWLSYGQLMEPFREGRCESHVPHCLQIQIQIHIKIQIQIQIRIQIQIQVYAQAYGPLMVS